jgi:hypothetical protein
MCPERKTHGHPQPKVFNCAFPKRVSAASKLDDYRCRVEKSMVSSLFDWASCATRGSGSVQENNTSMATGLTHQDRLFSSFTFIRYIRRGPLLFSFPVVSLCSFPWAHLTFVLAISPSHTPLKCALYYFPPFSREPRSLPVLPFPRVPQHALQTSCWVCFGRMRAQPGPSVVPISAMTRRRWQPLRRQQCRHPSDESHQSYWPTG